MTPTFEFYNREKEAWQDCYSVSSVAEMNRLNAIIGWEFYRRKGAQS